MSSSNVRMMSLAMICVAVAACGGGGGGGADPGAPIPPPPATPPAPTTGLTGLTDPSLQLSTSTSLPTLASSFLQIAREMSDAYEEADAGAAGTEAGKLMAGVSSSGTTACPGGGSYTVTGTSPNFAVSFANCTSNGYSFSGSTTLALLAPDPGYRLTYASLATVGPSGFNGAVSGDSHCVTNTSGTRCVTKLAGFMWGYDSTYFNGTANGTHQCTCTTGSWNVLFDDFAATSGIAYVYASNGTASVTRTGAKTFVVQQTLTGGSPTQPFQVTLP